MLVLLGLDHRKASVEARGRLSFTGAALTDALRTLSAHHEIDEVIILSTCNRTEIYIASAHPEPAIAEALRFCRDTAARSAAARHATHQQTVLDAIHVEEAVYTARGPEAVAHLFHVAAGLRSMVVGEAQILGQVRDALTTAESIHSAGEELRAAFTGALQAGKRVRTDTDISKADESIAGLAIQAARAELGSLAGKTVTLVGAGRTNQLSAQLLRGEGVNQLIIVNRNVESARALATLYGATPLALDDVSAAIAQSDLLICATAAPYTVVTSAMIAPRDSRRPLVIVDLAVPSDVTADAGALPYVTLLTLDTLPIASGSALEDPSNATAPRGRQADIEDAERIIHHMLEEYKKAQTLRKVAPGIAALRKHVDQSEEQELARALAQLAHLSEQDRAVIERFGSRLVDKMFHHLVRRIRTLAEYDEIPTETTMRVLAQLFSDPERKTPGEDSDS